MMLQRRGRDPVLAGSLFFVIVKVGCDGRRFALDMEVEC